MFQIQPESSSLLIKNGEAFPANVFTVFRADPAYKKV